MNQYADLGESVDVWETAPSDTLADRSFAPISETGIELTNDYEPVVYQANRALMAANAAQEINELQERNHATTAYSTLDCNAVPLFPTFDAQRAVDCGIRQARRAGLNVPPNLVAQPVPPLGYPPQSMMGVEGYYAKGPTIQPVLAAAHGNAAKSAPPRPVHDTAKNLLPPKATPVVKAAAVKTSEGAEGVCTKDSCNADACTCDIPCTCASEETCKCPVCPQHNIKPSSTKAKAYAAKKVEAAANAEKQKAKARFQTFSKKMVRAAAGAAYDLKHWESLPPRMAGDSSTAVLSYAMTRDSRGSYLLLWLGLIVLFLALVGVAIGLGCKHKS